MNLLNIYETLKKVEDGILHACRASFRIVDGGLCLEVRYKRSTDGEVFLLNMAWSKELIRDYNSESLSEALIEQFIKTVNTAIRKSYESVERKEGGPA